MSFLEERLKEKDYLPLSLMTAEMGTEFGEEREKIRELLEEKCYGRYPKFCGVPTAEVQETCDELYEVKADCSKIALTFPTPNGNFTMPVELMIPAGAKDVPVILCIRFRDVKPSTEDIQLIIDSGFAYVNFNYHDVVKDSLDSDFTRGLAEKFVNVTKEEKREPDVTGKIGLWAYACSRVMDWITSVPRLDPFHVTLVGHSRLGKTALWAAANDFRFWCVVSNDSGFGGAACAKHGKGERISDFVRHGSKDWFCETFLDYLDREDERPFDQHFLLSLIAPRLMCVGSAEEDPGADPEAEFLTSLSVSPLWERFERSGLVCPDRMPVPGDTFGSGCIQYHIRAGKHGLIHEDWIRYLSFIKSKYNEEKAMSVLKDFYCDKLHVRVFDSRRAMGDCAGSEAVECIKKLLEEKETLNVMFAAAPSQNETLEALCADTEIDWTRINAFHMDEYVGLDAAHPAGFRNFLKRAIFDAKPFRTINLLNGNAEDPEEEAKRYDQLLRDNPLDVCILGVGENGHVAFNDPPVADFDDPKMVKIVELEQVCRQQQVHDGCFEDISQVPTHALSVTVPGLMQAKHLFCSVPAKTKAEAIRHMINDEISEKCPATILRLQDDARLYTDADAGASLLE